MTARGDNDRVDPPLRHGANLPHLTRKGGTYAVTFRLADSIPRKKLEDWRAAYEILRRHELAQSRLLELEREYMAKIEKHLDAGDGICHLKDDRAASIVGDSLNHFDGVRYTLEAWCVMPNHVHAVLTPRTGHDLSSVLHSWKSFTALRINRLLGRTGPFWQAESYDHLIRDADDLLNQVRYVLNNPSEAGLKGWPWLGCSERFGYLLA